MKPAPRKRESLTYFDDCHLDVALSFNRLTGYWSAAVSRRRPGHPARNLVIEMGQGSIPASVAVMVVDAIDREVIRWGRMSAGVQGELPGMRDAHRWSPPSGDASD